MPRALVAALRAREADIQTVVESPKCTHSEKRLWSGENYVSTTPSSQSPQPLLPQMRHIIKRNQQRISPPKINLGKRTTKSRRQLHHPLRSQPERRTYTHTDRSRRRHYRHVPSRRQLEERLPHPCPERIE